MADSTNPLPSVKEPFVDRYRFINPVWLRWLKPLLETVKSTTTRVETVKAEVDGLTVEVTENSTAIATQGGRWGLNVNINGKTIGAITLNGGITLSEIDMLADVFRISHPTSTDIVITPFIVGIVDGIPTVGINGELVVDGTITANKITTTTLDSLSVNAGAIRAGSLESYSGNTKLDLDNDEFYIMAPP